MCVRVCVRVHIYKRVSLNRPRLVRSAPPEQVVNNQRHPSVHLRSPSRLSTSRPAPQTPPPPSASVPPNSAMDSSAAASARGAPRRPQTQASWATLATTCSPAAARSCPRCTVECAPKASARSRGPRSPRCLADSAPRPRPVEGCLCELGRSPAKRGRNPRRARRVRMDRSRGRPPARRPWAARGCRIVAPFGVSLSRRDVATRRGRPLRRRHRRQPGGCG